MNKNTNLIIGIVVALLLIGGGVFIFNAAQKRNTTTEQITAEEEQLTIGTLSPEDIGVRLVMSSNNHKVKVVADKVSDVKSLEYEITYDADIPAAERIEGGETRTTRGFNGDAKLSGQSKYESKEFDLGSCSKNVCRYDTGVESLDIMMKVIKKDGKIYQVKDSLAL